MRLGVRRRAAYGAMASAAVAIGVVAVGGPVIAAVGQGASTVTYGFVVSGVVLVSSLTLVLIAVGVAYWVSEPITRSAQRIRVVARNAEGSSFRSDLDVVAREVDEEIRAVLSSVEQLHVRHAQRGHGVTSLVAALLHDQKAPVAGLSFLAASLPPDAPLPEHVRQQVVASANAVGLGLTRAIDMLRVGAIDVALVRREMDVREAVDSIIARTAPIASGRDVAVDARGEHAGHYDAALIIRAVEAAIANAIAAARSRVEIEVLPGLVRVTDDGHGLQAPLETLLEPYVHGGAAIERAVPSSGLGLAIMRYALEAHGGRLRVEKSSDTGTVMLLYLGV